MDVSAIDFFPEFVFKASRSGGKGGQNVNKVSTKVELEFDIPNSMLLTEEQKKLLLEKLASRVSLEGVLRIVSQAERSQLANKKAAVKKFYEVVKKAFTPRKKRVATKPGKAAKEKRLKEKKKASERKEHRKRPSWD